MSLTEDLKRRFAEATPEVIEIKGLPKIFSKQLTLGQIRQIDTEPDTFMRIARHFQVRAKDADGRPLVEPNDLDEFMRYADMALITEAVSRMQAHDGESFEDTEKKS